MGVHDGYERGFDVTLDFGKQAEHYVARVFDSIASGATVEVKRDARCLDTGRLYIEYRCRGRDGIWRDSGIKTSTADWWVFAPTSGFMLWFERSVLFYLAERAYENPSRRREHPYGENPTRGVLLDLTDVVDAALEAPFAA